MDKFFADFNEKSADTKAAEIKAPRKGRFAALFSPPPPEEPATSVATAPIEHDADEAGFQRILQMLGQRSNNASPQDQSQQRSKPQSTAQREIPTQARSPENNGRLTETTSRDSPPQNRQSTGLENVLGPQSPTREHGPRPQSTSSKDTLLLLRLMQQPSYNQNPLPQPQPGSALLSGMRQTPGILQMPDNRNRLPKPQGEKLMQHPLLEKPAGFDSARNEQQAPREVLQRRPTNEHAPSFFDEPFFNELRQTGQQQEVNANQLRNQGVPIAMQRPPQQMPPQMTMGMPPPFQIAPAQRQRKYTGDGGAGFPPGMGPPGFMTNGPPPGFPVLPHGLGTAGAQLDSGGGMSSRHLMDLYARSGGRGGPSGGGGGNTNMGILDANPLLGSDLTARERRKIAMAEKTFEKIEQGQNVQKKKKRTSAGSTLNASSAASTQQHGYTSASSTTASNAQAASSAGGSIFGVQGQPAGNPPRQSTFLHQQVGPPLPQTGPGFISLGESSQQRSRGPFDTIMAPGSHGRQDAFEGHPGWPQPQRQFSPSAHLSGYGQPPQPPAAENSFEHDAAKMPNAIRADFYGKPIPAIKTMFVNWTISEDRTGTEEEIMVHRLAAFGARCEQKMDWRKIR